LDSSHRGPAAAANSDSDSDSMPYSESDSEAPARARGSLPAGGTSGRGPGLAVAGRLGPVPGAASRVGRRRAPGPPGVARPAVAAVAAAAAAAAPSSQGLSTQPVGLPGSCQ
jgi:hypothetical protein